MPPVFFDRRVQNRIVGIVASDTKRPCGRMWLDADDAAHVGRLLPRTAHPRGHKQIG